MDLTRSKYDPKTSSPLAALGSGVVSEKMEITWGVRMVSPSRSTNAANVVCDQVLMYGPMANISLNRSAGGVGPSQKVKRIHVVALVEELYIAVVINAARSSG